MKKDKLQELQNTATKCVQVTGSVPSSITASQYLRRPTIVLQRGQATVHNKDAAMKMDCLNDNKTSLPHRAIWSSCVLNYAIYKHIKTFIRLQTWN